MDFPIYFYSMVQSLSANIMESGKFCTVRTLLPNQSVLAYQLTISESGKFCSLRLQNLPLSKNFKRTAVGSEKSRWPGRPGGYKPGEKK